MITQLQIGLRVKLWLDYPVSCWPMDPPRYPIATLTRQKQSLAHSNLENDVVVSTSDQLRQQGKSKDGEPSPRTSTDSSRGLLRNEGDRRLSA
jgi:hypothetical protein